MRGSLLGRLLGGIILITAVDGAIAATQTPGDFRDCSECPPMTIVPAGVVAVGDPADFEGPADPDRPKVTIDRPFALGTFEVTQAEWEALMGDNPSLIKGPALPVTNVSWKRAQEYIERLRTKTGKPYRLPGEAEWEYAARAGSTASYAFGDDTGQMARHAWFDANSGGVVQPVGTLQPNAFGLYDMHGNVWEWTGDCYTSNFGDTLAGGTLKNFENFCYRVIRGGSVLNYAKHLAAFYRTQLTPVNFNTNLGFRVALTLH